MFRLLFNPEYIRWTVPGVQVFSSWTTTFYKFFCKFFLNVPDVFMLCTVIR